VTCLSKLFFYPRMVDIEAGKRRTCLFVSLEYNIQAYIEKHMALITKTTSRKKWDRVPIKAKTS
jgi:hypothetical protein